jgi:hypothetical protein
VFFECLGIQCCLYGCLLLMQGSPIDSGGAQGSFWSVSECHGRRLPPESGISFPAFFQANVTGWLLSSSFSILAQLVLFPTVRRLIRLGLRLILLKLALIRERLHPFIVWTQADELSGFHSNTHIPLVVGAQTRYEIVGDSTYGVSGL